MIESEQAKRAGEAEQPEETDEVEPHELDLDEIEERAQQKAVETKLQVSAGVSRAMLWEGLNRYLASEAEHARREARLAYRPKPEHQAETEAETEAEHEKQ